jgi:hypothetical protein
MLMAADGQKPPISQPPNYEAQIKILAFVRETSMLKSNSGHKEASTCHF